MTLRAEGNFDRRGQENARFVKLMDRAKHKEGSFSPISLCLRVVQMSRTLDLAIFCRQRERERPSRLLYPLRMPAG